MYQYTLQPVPLDIKETEWLDAFALHHQVPRKTWLILAAVMAFALLGIIFLRGYSTIFFWVVLVCAVIFGLARVYGLRFWIKRQLGEQIAAYPKGIRVGVQPFGLVMFQKMGNQEGRGQMNWNQFSEWRENENLILLYVANQPGFQVIPKRLNAQKFPIETLRKHLSETLGPAKTV